ncbi:MAG: hypothetical protein P8Y81_14975 [Ignavibacteriaceae bacterium]
MDTYNVHFHILLGGDNKDEVKNYGELLMHFWLKYFGALADNQAQYLEQQVKSPLENFKYLFKFEEIKKILSRLFIRCKKQQKIRTCS